jgi:hypothetical protein
MATKKQAGQEDMLTSIARSVGTTAGTFVARASQLTAAATAKAAELADSTKKKLTPKPAKPAKKRVSAKKSATKRPTKKRVTAKAKTLRKKRA